MFNISGMSVLVPVFLIPLGFILNPLSEREFRMETRDLASLQNMLLFNNLSVYICVYLWFFLHIRGS